MSKGAYQNLFGIKASDYAKFRPLYPRELFQFIASCAPSQESVWDCGTGSGQAAVALAEFFQHVTATDVSASQIEHAQANPKVEYKVAPAEQAPLAEGTVDVVTAANAVHWFDVPAFFKEVQRVLKPGGIVAVWCYTDLHVDGELGETLEELKSLVKPYWPEPIRRYVAPHYRTLEFPFEEVPTPAFKMTTNWNPDQFLGYVSTWSAVEFYKEENHRDPLAEAREKLSKVAAANRYEIVFDMPVRVGRFAT